MNRELMVRMALANSRHTVGRAFCVALGVAHLVAPARGEFVYREPMADGVMECFRNAESPMDRTFL